MTRLPLQDQAALKTARFARSLVAGVFVAGIVALIATQPGPTDRPENAFLHAPAQTPSKPSVEPLLVDPLPAVGEAVIAA